MADKSTATAAKRVEPQITAVASGLTIPTSRTSNRGSKSSYPFDTLTEIGTAFGVKNKTAKQLSSIVSNQNRKASNQAPRKDENGNPVMKMVEVKDPSGNVIGKQASNEPETDPIKEFRAFDVTPEMAKQYKGTPLEGASVVVFRVK